MKAPLLAATLIACVSAAALASPPANMITLSDASGSGESNYPFQFGRPFLDGAIPNFPQVLINGAVANSQADVKNRYPDGSVEYAVMAVVVPTIPVNGAVSLTFQNATSGNNAPLTPAQMLDPAYNFDATDVFAPNSGAPVAVSARAMMGAGACKPWTTGQVAQTMICADDTAARSFDVGLGDGFRPLRPRFYVTFWQQTHQVSVRAVVESGLTSDYEDTAYKAEIVGGILSTSAPGPVEYAVDLSGTLATTGCPAGDPCPDKIHWAGSAWTASFWLGGAPSPQVDIDNSLAYLESTRFLPNYDTSTVVDPTAIEGMYALWAGKPHNVYDGVWDGGLWTNYMGTPGARYDISPAPTWTTMWLYTGNWRMRQMSLGMADLAANWPYHLRETNVTKSLNRGDAAGTGLGLPFSIIGRPTLVTYEGDLNYSTAPSDMVQIVGPYDIGVNPWGFEGSHEPAAFYPQYVLTGDPWYLNEMEMWASWDAARYIVAGNLPYGRGPDGSYGGVNDEVRGAGWVMRERAEAAFAAPDTDPEKVYLQTLVNDALARWEGVFAIAGTAYDGTAMKTWGASTGDYWSWNLGPNAGKAPTLHYWESNGNPTVDNSQVDLDVSSGWFLPNAVGSITDLWMHWYSLYSLGRAAELGFAAGPFQQYTGQLLTGLINSSGTPKIIGAYEVPSEIKGGGFPATYAAWLALFTSSANSTTNQFLTCAGTMPGGQLCLADYFASNLYSQGRPAYAAAALAPLVDEGAPGATAAWSWIDTNARQAISLPNAYGPSWSGDPSWDVIPRTDTNKLPPQPLMQ